MPEGDYRGIGWVTGLDSFSSTEASSRITFDLLSRTALEYLQAHPPVIRGHTFEPELLKWVEPVYPGEISVLGCKRIQGIKSVLTAYFRKKYGADSVLFHRMACHREVYTAVFKNFDIASRVLNPQEPFTPLANHPLLERFASPSRPHSLVLLNRIGLPTNYGFLSQSSAPSRDSRDVQELRAQFHSFKDQMTETTGMFKKLFVQHQQTLKTVQAHTSVISGAIGSMASMLTANMAMHTKQARLNRLERERDQLLLKHHLASDNMAKQDLLQQVASKTTVINALETQMDEEQLQATTATQLLISNLTTSKPGHSLPPPLSPPRIVPAPVSPFSSSPPTPIAPSRPSTPQLPQPSTLTSNQHTTLSAPRHSSSTSITLPAPKRARVDDGSRSSIAPRGNPSCGGKRGAGNRRKDKNRAADGGHAQDGEPMDETPDHVCFSPSLLPSISDVKPPSSKLVNGGLDHINFDLFPLSSQARRPSRSPCSRKHLMVTR
ncbi:hypothetical protein PM082_016397 [Marasmius tenuissimus]|nr:hypothetical protein PM082_016397 [Marasmius tenuissimus]